ncbi:MAG: hypothetical protein PHQ04_03410 [Opitutaceae bacterium]|nr:hypothetical protein [Opitutaceae bacterium]
MSVVPLTVFFSLLLAGIFGVLFLVEQHGRGLGGPERDSLLPFADEQPVVDSSRADSTGGRQLPAPAAGPGGSGQTAVRSPLSHRSASARAAPPQAR